MTPPHLPLALEWGQCGVRQLGETLSLSPALQAPGPRGRRVIGRQGPAPKSEWLRGGPLEGLRPVTHTPAQGQGAHSSKGARATDTFMIEKQLEWRQERHDYLGRISWRERVGGGAW